MAAPAMTSRRERRTCEPREMRLGGFCALRFDRAYLEDDSLRRQAAAASRFHARALRPEERGGSR